MKLAVLCLMALATVPAFGQCTFTLTPTSAHYTTASATGTIAVKASNATCPRPAAASDTWITITFGQTGTGDGSVGYTVDQNKTYSSRTATITIGSAVFTITQDGLPCTYSLVPDSQSAPAAGGSYSINLSTPCMWTATTANSWISLNTGSGNGNSTINYTVAPNTTYASRTGTISIASLSFTVTQAGLPCAYAVSPTSQTVTSAGGTVSIAVTTGCSWSVMNPASWISNLAIGGTPATSSTGNGTLTFTVAANTTSQPRTAILTVAGLAVTITQTGIPPQFTAAQVLNGANYKSGGVAPGELLAIFGSGLGPMTGVSLQVTSDGLSVTTTLGGTQVMFDGISAPLTYASDGQVNAIVPFQVSGNSSTQIVVQYQGASSAAITLPVVAAAPALFTVNGGIGNAASLNQDLSYNSDANPAARGSVIVLYGHGQGQTAPPGVNGALNLTVFPKPLLPVQIMIGGITVDPSNILYFGAAPGLVSGVFQANVTIPQSVTPGDVPVVVTIGGVASTAGVTIAVK